MSHRTLRLMACVIASLWFGFWAFFAFAEGLEGLSHVPMLLLMLFPIWLAWKGNIAGGILLILEGLFVMIAYPLMAIHRFPTSSVLFVLATLGLPPLLAGICFLLGGRDREPYFRGFRWNR